MVLLYVGLPLAKQRSGTYYPFIYLADGLGEFQFVAYLLLIMYTYKVM